MSDSSKFTFPTKSQDRYIVGDRVNVTWTVTAPIIALYEACGTVNRLLEEQQSNNRSYVWIASRELYKESGCNFMLQPFTAQRESYGDNITSVIFGVAKRYTGDPAPKDYNFAHVASTTTVTSTSSRATGTSSATASLSSSATSTSDSASTSAATSQGLSTSSKIGIGLGVPLGVLLVAAAIGAFFFFRRRARRSVDVPVINQDSDGLAALPVMEKGHQRHFSQTETLASSQPSSDYWRSTVRDSQMSEMDARDSQVSELMSRERVEIG